MRLFCSRRRPFRETLWKLGVGVLLFIATGAVVNFTLPVEQRIGQGSFGNDLMPSYAAGLLVRQGHGDAIFHPHAVTRVVREIWASCYPNVPPSRGLAPWLNPAFYALPFVPLAALPYPTALAVWVGVNALLLATAVAMLMRLLPTGTPWSTRALVPLLVVASFPFVQATTHQQNTFLSLAILSGALLLTTRAVASPRSAWHAYAAGAVAGLLLFKPQLGFALVVAVGVVLGRRAVLAAALVGASLMAIGERAIPGSTAEFLITMPAAVAEVQRRTGYTWSRQMTLLSFWQTLLRDAGPAAPLLAKALWLTTLAGVLAVLARVALRVRVAMRSTDAFAAQRVAGRWLAACVCAMPLVMPYYMDYDLLLLATGATLLAADVLVNRADDRSTSTADRRLAWTWVAMSLWLLFQPPVASAWRVNVTIVLLTTIATMMVRRVTATRPVVDAITAQRFNGPQEAVGVDAPRVVPAPSPSRAAA